MTGAPAVTGPRLLRRIVAMDHRAARLSTRLRHRFLTVIMLVLTHSGSGGVWFGLSAVLLLLSGRGIALLPGQEGLLSAMTGSFFSLLTGQVVKRAVKRRRPPMVLEGFLPLSRPPSDGSFPSTHSATAAALATGLLVSGHPLSPLLVPWAVSIPFTRYYLGVHFVSDILAGSLLGLAFGLWDYGPLVHKVVQLLS